VSQTIALSPTGAKFIGTLEGFRAECYDDGGTGKGNCTIGIGHLVHLGVTTPADKKQWSTITLEHALALLQADAHRNGVVAIQQNIKVPLTQPQIDALVSLCFNCGPGALGPGHAVTNAVNSKPKQASAAAMKAWRDRVSEAFMQWAHPAVLAGRRQKEIALFFTPPSTKSQPGGTTMAPPVATQNPVSDVGSSIGHQQPNKKPPKATPKKHIQPSKRDLRHAYMTATAGNPYGWNYREVRPLGIPAKLAHGINADCSFGVKILCDWAGVPDPTGSNYDGYGNSVSMFHHLPHVTKAQAKTGDILVFGPNGEWHATMILEPGADPLLWSHGHQGAPNLYRLSQDKRTPWTICQIAVQ
jgi:GH24 family phage-related lysozyme (muramidase)